MNVKCVVMHKKPHWDEIVAYWLALFIGAEAFPGINDARVEYWDEIPNKPSKQLRNEGYLLLGIGFGDFDDKLREGGRKEKKCTAILMAEALGIEKNPEFEKLLSFSYTADTQPKVSFLDPASVVKMLHNNHPKDPRVAIHYVFNLLDELKTQQDEFFTGTHAAYAHLLAGKPDNFQRIISPLGEEVRLVILNTDSSAVVAYGRSDHGGRAGILIKFGIEEATQIFLDPRLNLSKIAQDIICALRCEEGNLRRDRPWRELGKSGQVCEQDCWFGVAKNAGEKEQITIIANGTESKKRTPTRIPHERIVEIVKMCVTPGFEPSYEEDCKNNICTGNNCPWYSLGLSRCRTVRFNQRKAEERKTQNGSKKEETTVA